MKRLLSGYVFGGITLIASVVGVSAQDGEPKIIRGGVLNGKATSLPKPDYPEEARSAGIEGTVFVDVTIDEGGNIISAFAATEPRRVPKTGRTPEGTDDVPPAHPILRTAAEAAALGARFPTTLLSGVPVKVTGMIIYRFSKAPIVTDQDGALLGSGIVRNAIKLPKPAYPAGARRARAEGPVSVKVVVDENGDVVEVSAVSGHPLLREAAENAARGAKFKPSIVDGKPVKITGIVTYNFVAGIRR